MAKGKACAWCHGGRCCMGADEGPKGGRKVCCDLIWQMVLLFVQIVAALCSSIAFADCVFLTINYQPWWGGNPPPEFLGPNPLNVTGLGLVQFQQRDIRGNEQCVNYVGSEYEDVMDNALRYSAGFGIAAFFLCVVGWCISLLSLFLLCCIEMKGLKWILGVMFVIAAIFQGLTFFATTTDACSSTLGGTGDFSIRVECYIGRSAGFGIAAVVLQLFVGIMVCFMPWPDKPVGKEKCCCGGDKKDKDLDETDEKEAKAEGEGEDEKDVETGQEEAPAEVAPEDVPEEEDPNAAAAAAAGAAGGAAAANAMNAEEEEKEEIDEEANFKSEERGKEDIVMAATMGDVEVSAKDLDENSDFEEDMNDDDSSFEEEDSSDSDDDDDDDDDGKGDNDDTKKEEKQDDAAAKAKEEEEGGKEDDGKNGEEKKT